jgi:DNA-binding SARP family transcriptional activator
MIDDFIGTLVGHPRSVICPLLRLISGPIVTIGARTVDLPEGSKRLLAFVALRGGQVDRQYAAGTLWPSGSDVRAAGNLRSALWRLNGDRLSLLAGDRHTLVLRQDMLVDVRLITEWSSRLVAGTATEVDMGVPPLAIDAFELLPGWVDDWVLVERECLRQRILHALEALSRSHSRARHHAQAIDAAIAAVAVEPLRESAQRTLIEAHLAECNRVEARRCYEAYRELAHRELGVEPSADLRALVWCRREEIRIVELKPCSARNLPAELHQIVSWP